jgi:hypothetical protein
MNQPPAGGQGPPSALAGRSTTRSSTTSSTSPSISTSSTRRRAAAAARPQPARPGHASAMTTTCPSRRRTCRPTVTRHLRREGSRLTDGWRITLVTNLRVLGYVFNPASFYLCRDTAGALRAVVVEVHNTHGERTSTRSAPSDARGARADGQGLLRQPVHQHGRALPGDGPDRPIGCASASTRPRPAHLARQSLVAAPPAADRPACCARCAPPARDAEDDRVDPLARAPAVARARRSTRHGAPCPGEG